MQYLIGHLLLIRFLLSHSQMRRRYLLLLCLDRCRRPSLLQSLQNLRRRQFCFSISFLHLFNLIRHHRVFFPTFHIHLLPLRILISTLAKLPLQFLCFLPSLAVHSRHCHHIRVVKRVLVVENGLQLAVVEQTGDHFIASLRRLFLAVFVDWFLIDNRGDLRVWKDLAFREDLSRFGASLSLGWM